MSAQSCLTARSNTELSSKTAMTPKSAMEVEEEVVAAAAKQVDGVTDTGEAAPTESSVPEEDSQIKK